MQKIKFLYENVQLDICYSLEIMRSPVSFQACSQDKASHDFTVLIVLTPINSPQIHEDELHSVTFTGYIVSWTVSSSFKTMLMVWLPYFLPRITSL